MAYDNNEYQETNTKMLDYFKKSNSFKLRKLSGELISTAALNKSKICLHQSSLAYALSKLLSKPHYIKHKEWKQFKEQVEKILIAGGKDLKNGNHEEYENKLHHLSDDIKTIDEKFSHYVSNTLNKASIRAAVHLYSTGLTLKQAATLAETTEQAVLKYIGKTKVHEQLKTTKGIKQRLSELKRQAEMDK